MFLKCFNGCLVVLEVRPPVSCSHVANLPKSTSWKSNHSQIQIQLYNTNTICLAKKSSDYKSLVRCQNASQKRWQLTCPPFRWPTHYCFADQIWIFDWVAKFPPKNTESDRWQNLDWRQNWVHCKGEKCLVHLSQGGKISTRQKHNFFENQIWWEVRR